MSLQHKLDLGFGAKSAALFNSLTMFGLMLAFSTGAQATLSYGVADCTVSAVVASRIDLSKAKISISGQQESESARLALEISNATKTFRILADLEEEGAISRAIDGKQFSADFKTPADDKTYQVRLSREVLTITHKGQFVLSAQCSIQN